MTDTTSPTGKSAEEYMAEAAADSAPDRPRRASRSRSRSASASGAPTVPEPEVEVLDAPKELTPAFRRLYDGVMQIYTSAEMATRLLDPDVSDIIAAGKVDCVTAWIDLAQKDVSVKNLLTKMTTGAGWGGVVMAHMTLVIPILAKRGWIPGGALFDGALMNRMSAEPVQDVAQYRADAVQEYAQGIGVVTVPQ